MPLLSTLGAASSQSFGGRGGPDLTLTLALQMSMVSGSFSIPASANIVSGDMLIVAQGSGDSDVTTFPNPVADGYYSPSGTGFTRLGSPNFSNYASTGDSPQICASCGFCKYESDGNEVGTTISGFLPSGQDGYESSAGKLIGLRPNFDINTTNYKDDTSFTGTTTGPATITSQYMSLGVVPSTRCTFLVTVFMNHNSSNTNGIVFSKNIDSFRVYQTYDNQGGSGFVVSGLRYISVHVFPSGTSIGHMTISHTNTASGARMLNSVAIEIGTS